MRKMLEILRLPSFDFEDASIQSAELAQHMHRRESQSLIFFIVD